MNTNNSASSTSKKRTSIREKGQKINKDHKKETQEQFLKYFAECGNVKASCKAVGIDRSLIHYWCEHDEQFNMQYNSAKEDVNDAIRAEIFRRGIEGEERFVTSMGKVVYHEGKPLTIREKSDTLLIFHAKARMPEEYRDRQSVEHSGSVDVTGLKDMLLQKLAAQKDQKA